MNLSYKVYSAFPVLAWCATCNDGTILVEHGNNVEVKENFFVEGAWDSEFEDGNFVKSDWFCGTGGKIENDQIVFSTPTHVTNGLFLARMPQGGG